MTTALDTPSADPPAAPGPLSTGTDGSLGARLGIDLDPSLDELKKEGEAIYTLQAISRKRPKMTHSLFFEDDKGLKKILKTFPKIKVQGKGREYEDVTLLLQHYKKWFQELYPHGEHFEDLSWKARQVLQDKEKEDDGTISDPRERLHAFRFQYKNTPSAGKAGSTAHLSEEVRARIEANRKRALELKRQKEAAAGGAAQAPPEELDMDELWRREQEHAAASKSQGSGAPAFGFEDEEDDPFGFSGGFDGDGGAGAAKPASKAPAFGFDEEEDDVFGFGGGFDDEPDRPSEPPKPPTVSESKPPAVSVDPEIARRIAENRAKVLERKAALAAEATAAAGTADMVQEPAVKPDAPSVTEPAITHEPASTNSGNGDETTCVDGGFDEEEDVFDFGGFDDP